MRNPIWSLSRSKKPNGIPDKTAFLQERAKKQFFRNDRHGLGDAVKLTKKALEQKNFRGQNTSRKYLQSVA